MAFTEDLSQFFDQDDFAVAAIVKTGATVIRTINVIFNNPVQGVNVFDASVETNVPHAICQTADLADVRHGYTMTIDSVVYPIVQINSDGTGMSVMELGKA